jgi:hypothetical protein
MRRVWCLALAVLPAIAAVPVEAQQFHNFWTQCTMGSLRACASVDVTLIYHPPGSEYPLPGFISQGDTELRIRVSNLQGRPGPSSSSGAVGIRNVIVGGLASTTGTGPAGEMDWITSHFASQGMVSLEGALDFQVFEYTGGGRAAAGMDFEQDSYLFGCAAPVNASPVGGYDFTCDGSITYSVVIRREELRFTKDLSVRLAGDVWEPGDTFGSSGPDSRQAFACTSGADCVTVTPEPGTLLLLGSGLAGLFGASARHRRRKIAGR